MSSRSKALVAFSIVLLCSAASAQIVPTAAFTGHQSDGFESHPAGVFATCLQGRVFNNTADMCDPTGNALLVTGGWGFVCSIGPYAGSKFVGSAGGPAEYTFDTPANRFGGRFGTNCGIADATIEFYDVTNTLITSVVATIPANCTWSWSGWEVIGGPPIKRVKVIGLINGGGFVDMDDMQVDYGAVCAPPTTYCTPKLNSLGCTPSIQWVGTPSATAPSGCTVRCINVRNNKPGILIYNVSGPASAPFAGGIFCLQLPIKRTPPGTSGGTPAPASDCSGVYTIDMNAYARGLLGGVPLAALQVPGTVVNCQFWGVDPGFPAPNNVTLSDGLEYTVCQ